MTTWIEALVGAAAVGSGLMAGLFFVFSNFAMRALGRIPTPGGMSAMQSINVTILNPVFLGLFLGVPMLCGFLLVISFLNTDLAGRWYLVGAGVTYLVGTLLVTIVCNVPRNDALARVEATGPDAEVAWREYLRTWTRWNHVRSWASLVAAVLFTAALAQI